MRHRISNRRRVALGEALGTLIARARATEGKSQMELAMDAECTQSEISALEKHGLGSVAMVRKVFTVLGIATGIVGSTLEVDWVNEDWSEEKFKFALPELRYD